MSDLSSIDLHLHSTRSDGKLTPTELVRVVAARGIAVAAVTDHDSTEGLDEALEEAELHSGLRIIPGIEMSADSPLVDQGDLHILGYFLDYKEQGFQDRLREFRNGRIDRAKLMVEKLGELGLPVDWKRVAEIAAGASVGRPHIAQAMVENGYIENPKEAFNEFLQDGGKAHIERPHISAADAIQLIQSVGGVAVMAHPLYAKNYRQVLPSMADLGAVGMEVHYAEFDKRQRMDLNEIAKAYGLLPCGGSDYHAFGLKGELLPGSAGPTEEVLRKLENLAG